MSANGQESKKIWLKVVLPIFMVVLVFTTVFSSTMLFIVINNQDVLDSIRKVFSESSSTKVADRGLSNVISGTVELTIPKEFVDFMGEDYDYTLTEEQKQNGFTKVEKADDGSAVFTIKKKDYDAFIKDMHQNTVESFQEMGNTLQGSSITNISYSQKFDKIILTVNKDKFENGLDGMYVTSIGLTSIMYQMFDIEAKGKCTIDIQDKDTGEIFKTVVYPDELNK